MFQTNRVHPAWRERRLSCSGVGQIRNVKTRSLFLAGTLPNLCLDNNTQTDYALYLRAQPRSYTALFDKNGKMVRSLPLGLRPRVADWEKLSQATGSDLGKGSMSAPSK